MQRPLNSFSLLQKAYDAKRNQLTVGLGSEFKLQDNIITMPFGPQLVQQNHPGRLINITSSRTFLSYINHECVAQTYQGALPIISDGRLDVWYTRDLIYNSCYPDITIEKKRGSKHGYIAEVYREHILPVIQKKYPLLYLTKPFTFNVDEYFKQKKENNVN